MEKEHGFEKVLEFFKSKQETTPGDAEYNAAFCKCLIEDASARESSIWQLNSDGRFRLVYGTNVAANQIVGINLREGEGISGAVALSRRAIAISDAWSYPKHDRRVDEQIDFRTYAMISAPIIFNGILYGVLNMLNHISGKTFPFEWQERLSIAGIMYAEALALAGRLHPHEDSTIKKGTRKKINRNVSEGRTNIVGISRGIRDALNLCIQAGNTNIPALILGETGTGKELAARRIHEASDRAKGPFIEVNCAALTETLLESELFGHVKGAFADAFRDRSGKFLAASGGTLFLDEIGDMSPSCQAKILRALQENKVTPVGSEKTITCDVRVIAATNHDLEALVKKKKFRDDLFYRLAGFEIIMPPLRERVGDVHLLAMYFVNQECTERKRKDPSYESPRISKETNEILAGYSWPGNVRELEQAVKSAVAKCVENEITVKDLPARIIGSTKTHSEIPHEESAASTESDRPLDKERLRYIKALEQTKYQGTGRWNVSKAAEKLGIARSTLVNRMKKSGIFQ